MSETQMISVKKIKTYDKLKNALKHNLRQIPRELGENRHIDPKKCCLNRVLVGGSDPSQMVKETEARVLKEQGKPLRKNGVLAIEYVISLRSGTKVITSEYFPAVVDWLEDYLGSPIISAVVHLDEANPHIHVLVLPLRNGRMIGSELVGHKGDLARLKQSHYKCVGQHFGLKIAESIPRHQLLQLSQQVVQALHASKDLLDQPIIRSALVNAIQIKPHELMAILGIKLTFETTENSKPYPV
jgi:hypothetical protein